MFCYNCGCRLSGHDFCTSCGADVALYKKVIHVSNMYYNEGLEKASVRDLSGAVASLRRSLMFDKSNIKARNLLGLVYFEMGEVVTALSQWVISKNMSPGKNIADEYIEKLQYNSARLDTFSQTIKKFNRAVALCSQDSRDLAVIQLKKVLSLNPRFIRAHQLLALLYMEREDWEKAERELRKCMDIDRNNVQTLRYLREAELMLMPDETVRQPAKRRKDESIRYQSENEIISQPTAIKEPRRSGVGTLLNLGIGLVIGLAAAYFLLVPAAQAEVRNEDQQVITRISNESDVKTARIQELEGQVSGLDQEMTGLRQQIEGYVGTDGTLQTIDSLLQAAADYTETKDVFAAAASLEAISQRVDVGAMSEGFQRLYQAIMGAVGPELSSAYYTQGTASYWAHDYAAAIETLKQAVRYDAGNADALFYLGEAYRHNGDTADAVATYSRVAELFPNTNRGRTAGQYRDNLIRNNPELAQ